jgi:hypothetical protein
MSCSLFAVVVHAADKPVAVVKKPEFVNHTRPAVDKEKLKNIDGGMMMASGCVLINSEWNRRLCGAGQVQGPLADIGCKAAITPDPLLTELDPSYPMVSCSVAKPFLYQSGCDKEQGTAYVITRDGKKELVTSLDTVRTLFAPIDSDKEALAYALIASGLYEQYGQKQTSENEYLAKKIEDSYVETTDAGYVVHLFDFRFCGCGKHETSAVAIQVSKDGDVKELSRQMVYRDAKEHCQN